MGRSLGAVHVERVLGAFLLEAGSRTPDSLLRGAVQAMCTRSIPRTVRLRVGLPTAR